jgi:hypothetical protein
VGVWLIALLVALVATIQIRSQAEVERSLVGVDATSLAFSSTTTATPPAVDGAAKNPVEAAVRERALEALEPAAGVRAPA